MRRIVILLMAWVLSSCTLALGTPTPLPTPDAPVIEFQTPANNARVIEGTDLTIDLVASDSGAGVARVTLDIDGAPHQQSTPEISPEVPVFTVRMNWVAAGVGLHSLTATAYRTDGRSISPTTIVVEVVPRP
ncbi:MAG TPA: Ig-like domain-containing protein [Aggregatilineales bacterium]|nr:Ig-like domain-containing protein [Aggregatilineales bacterium]